MTKLTLKPTTTLSAVTQAKLTALMADTVKQTHKHGSPGLIKTKSKTITPLAQTSAKTQSPSQLETGITKQQVVAPQPKASPQWSRSPDQRAEKTAVAQTEEETKPHRQAKRPYRTREEQAASKERIVAAQTWLIETYPAVFNKETPKPLKLGVDAKLLTQRPATISYHQLKDALKAWTYQRTYLQAVLDHDQRYDLGGEPVELILPAQKEHAGSQLALKKQRYEERQQRLAKLKERKLSHDLRDKPGDNPQESAES